MCGKGGAAPASKLLRLALLGVAGTGKSTFYKQLKVCFNGGFSEEEVQLARTVVASNLVFGVRDLWAELKSRKVKVTDKAKEASILGLFSVTICRVLTRVTRRRPKFAERSADSTAL